MTYAYVNQPVLPPGVKPALAPRAAPSGLRKWRWGFIVLGVFLLGFGGLLWRSVDTHNPIPARVQQSAHFPLFYPGWLPDGAGIDPSSFDITSQAMTFTVTYDHGKKLLFSEQPKPAQFDFDTFYSEQLTNKEALSIAIGSATIGQFEHAPFASIVTDKTWLLLHAPNGIDAQQFHRLVRSVRS